VPRCLLLRLRDRADDHQEFDGEVSVRHGFRVLSSYRATEERIWVIIETDRSATTFLLPDEY
jgi:hypothetical protein